MALHSAIKTEYPFLVRPPPQKRRPLQPPPPPPSSRPSFECAPHRRSAIAAWAAHVQPGSPTPLSPRSPHRRPSLRRGRCPSVTSIRATSVSFLHVAPTPTTAHITTPSVRNFKADLTTVGYTSVFLQLPNTPISATLPLTIKPPSPNVAKNMPVPPVPSPTCKPRGFTRFRSLSVLRSRGRSKSVGPDSSMKMKAGAAAAIVKRKKAKYAMRPPLLSNELAVMQFADGGNTDDNIKRLMQAQAKAAGAVGLADVYRDSEGGIWWDQDEEWEYAHLLSEGDECRPHATGDLQWVTFGGNPSHSMAGIPGEERRGSVSTQYSDLDPEYVVQPIDLLDGDDLALFGSAIVPLAIHRPAMSVLSLPSRPRRAAKHLRKPGLLVDVAFSRLCASPKNPKSPTSAGVSIGLSNPKGKARRRPPPLKLSPPSLGSKRPTNSPIDADKVRKDFIEASFEPVVSIPVMPATAISLTTPVDVRARQFGSSRATNAPRRAVNNGLTSLRMKTKPSVFNMIGHFRSARKEAVMC
ncbi:hypothetical protein J3R82DRAFT_2639 [Butyriboletus roseoflavus]|nr:hypothetical protein J3R82DRAFT_2639 [Butyriboletus roseoflavus]